MKKADIISAILFLIFAALVIISTSQFPDFSGEGVTGPDFFPRVLGIILIVLSILLFINAILSKDNGKTGLFDKAAIRAYITIGAVLIYVVLMNILGFIIVNFLFLFGLIRYYGLKNYLKVALTSVVGTAGIYCIFKILLAVPLPTGLLG
ncbi:hypothetical protein GOM49_06085 [Clostridium bovifaecis]|uniref:DUF1468 domain-containing protein n=1 Tax=Clostridium bovifaecis TaxID=2184719 RepID=A0A6I6EQM9_9CLOT|nr:hypothetical protein GOM49_06085 [Clostridium bovifaecis]